MYAHKHVVLRELAAGKDSNCKLITKSGKPLCRLLYQCDMLYVRRNILPSAIHTEPTADILPADSMKVGNECFIITYHYEWNGHMSVRHVVINLSRS